MSESANLNKVEQCIALTESGERCTRTAGDGAFCHQHDEDSPTLEEADDVDADSVEEALEERGDLPDEGGEASQDDTPDPADLEGSMTLPEIREYVQTTADDVIGRPLDGIVSIVQNEEGWVVRVDCLERRAVPDTQDILGQYAIEFSADGTIQGYSRSHRHRRGDTGEEDVGSLMANNN